MFLSKDNRVFFHPKVKPSTPKAERRGSLKLGAIAEERNIVTTSKETGKNVIVILYLAKKIWEQKEKNQVPQLKS